MKYSIVTFGCQMNKSDSERLATTLDNLGFTVTDNWDDSRLVIFNTCSVRQKAEDKVVGMVRKLTRQKENNPNLLIGITGCMTRVSSTRNSEHQDKLLKKLKGLDIAFRIEDLPKLGGLLKEADPSLATQELEEGELKNYFQINPRYSNKFQAFVPIMTGCDKFCTYCIVPFTRGREISRPIDDIYEEIEKLVANGCREVTLLGQNVNSYGSSWADKRSEQFTYDSPPFVQLMKKIDTIPDLVRLRFTSPHPQDMTSDVVETIAKARTLMPYIHLPVQSGSNEVLRRMNRNYTREDFLGIIADIRKWMPNCAISTDIIVGFPGETDEQFMETYELFKEVRFDMSFTARFSSRKGTAAERLMTDDVTHEKKAERWHMLNELLKEISLARHLDFVGQEVEVLVEEYDEKKGVCKGRTEHFKFTEFPCDKSLVGQFVKVHVEKGLLWQMNGRMV